MLSSFYRHNWTLRSRTMLVLLLGLGFLGNLLAVPLFIEFHYLFGSIAALVALRLYGGLWGLGAGLIAASATMVLSGHPYAMLWLGLEPLLVGYLTQRWQVRNMVIADALYWPLLGGPLIFAVFHFVLQINTIGVVTTILMYWVIGITNSLFASLIIDHLPLQRWIGDPDQAQPLSIHHLLFNLFMTIILVPAIIIMVHGGRRAARDNEATTIDRLQDTHRTVSYELRLRLAGYTGEIQELLDALEHSEQNNDQSFVINTAHHAFEEFRELNSFRVLDAQNRPIIAIPEHATNRLLTTDEQRFYNLLLTQDRIMVSPYLRPADDRTPHELLLGTGFTSPNKRQGIITISLQPHALQALLNKVVPYQGQSVTVTDANARVILTNRPNLELGEYFDLRSNREIRPIDSGVFRSAPKGGHLLPGQLAEQTEYVREAVIHPDIPWVLTIEAPYGPIRQTIMLEIAGKLAGLIGLGLVSLALSIYLANRITSPIRRLSSLTTDLPAKLSRRQELAWPSSSIAEMDQLISNSRTMADSLSEKFTELAHVNATLEDRVTERTRELTEANAFLSMEIRDRMKAEDERDNYLAAMQQQLEFLEILLEAIPNPIFFKDRQGRYLGSNHAFLKLINRHKDDFIGKTVYEIFPADIAEISHLADESLFNRGGVQQYETMLEASDGTLRDVIFYKATYGDAENRIAGLVGVVLDITDRKRMEAERDRLMLELTQKNKELEGIVYAASHDLRSPLINIEGFSRKLAKSCARIEGLLTESGPTEQAVAETLEILRDAIPKSLNFINTSTEKMDMLLKGLLRLSRLGRAAMHIERLNMNQLLPQVIAAMNFQLQNCGAKVNLGTLPDCLGDAAQINQVFSNLLDNAVKYRDPDRPLTIQISGNLDGNQAIYLVTDNGIGIANEHLERVWEIFHRLNPKGSDGEGLGLTIVRRIIDRNNGTVRIESLPGEGSTFIISLPALPPHPR